MGARSGNNYLSALRRRKAVLWFDDVRVEDPTVHPVLRPLARTIASLYDLQMEHPAAMTYRLEDGDRIGYSYVQAQTAEDLQRRSLMLRRWAELSAGVIEETPDTMNLALAAMASAADFFGAGDARLAKNLTNYYREARHRDWCIAGAMLSSASDLEIVNQHDGGIIVKGKQRFSILCALAEELLLFRNDAQSAPQAIVFAIGANTPGIELRCHSSTAAQHAAASMRECVATFERVLIPMGRVFLSGDTTRCNSILEQTGLASVLKEQRALKAAIAAEVATRNRG